VDNPDPARPSRQRVLSDRPRLTPHGIRATESRSPTPLDHSVSVPSAVLGNPRRRTPPATEPSPVVCQPELLGKRISSRRTLGNEMSPANPTPVAERVDAGRIRSPVRWVPGSKPARGSTRSASSQQRLDVEACCGEPAAVVADELTSAALVFP